MDLNPYQSPPADWQPETEQPNSRFTLAMAGLLLGLLCGSVSAFFGGALGGCTYRLFHDVSYGGDGFFGLFKYIATPLDFVLFHGTLAVLPLALWGGVLGLLQGVRVARIPLGVLGIILFAVAGLLVGLLNGVLATNAPSRVVPYFVEGPLASAVFGSLTAVIAWMVFRKRMNSIAQRPTNQQISFILHALLTFFGGLGVLFVMIPVFGWGTDVLQVIMWFGAIISLSVVLVALWSLWKRSR